MPQLAQKMIKDRGLWLKNWVNGRTMSGKFSMVKKCVRRKREKSGFACWCRVLCFTVTAF